MAYLIEYAKLYVHGRPGMYIVSDTPEGGCNIMPGATYFHTKNAALQGIDIYKVVDGDGQKFWHLLRAIQRQEHLEEDF